MDTSAICIFGTHRMSFLFLSIPISKFSSNVQEFNIRSISSLISSRFIRRFARTWIYPFTFTEFKLFPLHSLWDLRENKFLLSRSGNFPSHDDMQISLTMFLIDGTNLLPVTPLFTKKTKQTTATNNKDK